MPDSQSDPEAITPQVVEDGAVPEAAEEEGSFVTEPSKLIRIASMTASDAR